MDLAPYVATAAVPLAHAEDDRVRRTRGIVIAVAVACAAVAIFAILRARRRDESD